jgi:DnaJ-class molecular chaperone
MAPDDEFEMESCRGCRGEGKVISNLGGSPSEVDCPWCEGSGKFLGPEHDAQAHWGGKVVESAESSEKPPEEPLDA